MEEERLGQVSPGDGPEGKQQVEKHLLENICKMSVGKLRAWGIGTKTAAPPPARGGTTPTPEPEATSWGPLPLSCQQREEYKVSFAQPAPRCLLLMKSQGTVP